MKFRVQTHEFHATRVAVKTADGCCVSGYGGYSTWESKWGCYVSELSVHVSSVGEGMGMLESVLDNVTAVFIRWCGPLYFFRNRLFLLFPACNLGMDINLSN